MSTINPALRIAVSVRAGRIGLAGDLTLPCEPCGIVVFVHGSGSNRQSARDRHVSQSLVYAGFATLMFDLLTASEEAAERTTGIRFDTRLVADRLSAALVWLASQPRTGALPVGLFGSRTGAAAAVIAAARAQRVGAVVSRAGRPDLAGAALCELACPTLLVVAGNDPESIDRNRRALQRMSAPTRLAIIPGAGPRFDEAGTLDEVARLATDWFRRHLVIAREPPPRDRSLHHG